MKKRFYSILYMTENLNLRNKHIFIKSFEILVYFVIHDDGKYLRLIQMNCDKHTMFSNTKFLDNNNSITLYKHFNVTHTDNFKILKLYKKTYITQITVITNLYNVYTKTIEINYNIFYYSLHYDYENSLFNKNVKRLVYNSYLKNTIESILSYLNSNNKAIISLRNAYYKTHLKYIKEWEIDIMKNDDIETYNKYLILVQSYEHNNHLYRDSVKDECPICFTYKNVHTFYRCEHYICKICFINWFTIKTNCPICRGY